MENKITIDSDVGRHKWLVTGGAGFLGLHLCRLLAKKGQEVISYDIQPTPANERAPGVLEVIGDIRDREKMKKHLQGVDFVIHCAAALALAPPDEIKAVNAEAAKTLLEDSAQAKVKRLVYVGTTAVYGMPKFHPIYENAPLDPMGDYGIAKAKAEKYCLDAQGIETVLIRPKSFIGTGRLGIFQVLCDWIESGKRIYISR